MHNNPESESWEAQCHCAHSTQPKVLIWKWKISRFWGRKYSENCDRYLSLGIERNKNKIQQKFVKTVQLCQNLSSHPAPWAHVHPETPVSPWCRQQGNFYGTLASWFITQISRFPCKHTTEKLQLLPSWLSHSHIPTVRMEYRNICCSIGC